MQYIVIARPSDGLNYPARREEYRTDSSTKRNCSEPSEVQSLLHVTDMLIAFEDMLATASELSAQKKSYSQSSGDSASIRLPAKLCFRIGGTLCNPSRGDDLPRMYQHCVFLSSYSSFCGILPVYKMNTSDISWDPLRLEYATPNETSVLFLAWRNRRIIFAQLTCCGISNPTNRSPATDLRFCDYNLNNV